MRLWAAEGKSHFYRQNIILSHTPSQYIDALFNKILSRNLNGKIELKTNENLKSLGVKNVPLPIPQIFHRIKGNSLQQAFDNRLKGPGQAFEKLSFLEKFEAFEEIKYKIRKSLSQADKRSDQGKVGWYFGLYSLIF